MNIFLTGSTGFVGSHLLQRLLREGHEIRALVRKKGRVVGAGSGTLEEVEGDLNSKELAAHIAGCDAVINLVGIIYEQGSNTFEEVHHLGTRNLVEAASKNNIRRFVQMSALGARASNATAYQTTKFAAEEEVRLSAIPHVILRPSLIFGRGSAFIQQMIDLIRAVPLVRPVPGTGEYRFRPIHVSDVIECFVQSLTNREAESKTIQLVGADEVTLNEITESIAQCLNVKKIPLHIPMPVMKAFAIAIGALPFKSPVTQGQLRMLEEGSTADPGPMEQIFRITPAGFREAIKHNLRC